MKALLLLAFCASASAQTFDYTSTPMGGEIQTLSMGATSIATNPITGFLTAEVVLSNNVLTSFSASFNVNGTVMPIDFGPWQGLASQGPVWAASTGLITQVGSDFNWAIANQIYHYGSMDLQIGASDQFSFAADNNGTCANLLSANGTAYMGSSVLCSVSAAGANGTWAEAGVQQAHSVAAPEINPAGALGAFLLLAGGLAVIRGGNRLK
jgi:hypothetical protein